MGRRKTQAAKRILLLATVAVVLAAAAGGAYVYRQHAADRRALDAREAGVAALARGEDEAALDGIGTYMRRFADKGATTEDFVLYARARRAVKTPGSRNLLDAAAFLRRALDMDPSRIDARRDLLDIYVATGCGTEALEEIDKLLPASPGDLKLLRTRREILEALRRFQPALDVAVRINELNPGDLEDSFATLRLMVDAEKPAEEIDSWLDATLAARPDDRRLDLLRSAVLALRNEPAKAREMLDRVVSSCPTNTDPTFVAYILDQYDSAGRFTDSMELLQRLDRTAAPKLLAERLRRLWYGGRLDEISSSRELWEVEGLRTDPEVLAIRILAARAAGRKDEALPLEKQLGEAADDVSKAWSSAIAVRAGGGGADSLPQIQAAISVVPGSAILRQGLGDAYAAVGETELALEAWKAAAGRAAAWAAPLRRVAEALLAGGRAQLAAMTARAAVDRAPNDAGSVSVLIRATSAATPDLDARQLDVLLKATQSFRGDAAARSDEMLPFHVSLLLKADKAAADAAVREAVSAEPALGEATLLRLARLAASAGMSWEPALLDRCEKAHGMTPALALYRAIAASRRSGVAEGARLFDSLRTQATAAAASTDWETARAMYLDASGSPDAGAAWIALADAHPDTLASQLGALGSVASWKDRTGVARVIGRVEKMTGETATTWRIAKARWLMGADVPAESDLAEAASLLSAVIRMAPGDTTARLLNARALERLGNMAAAQDQLRVAAQLAPDDTSIALEIARVLQSQGDLDGARRQLDHALAAKDLEPAQVERAAWLLAQSGDRGRSADLLESMAARSDAPREGVLMLATTYASLGRSDRAIELCERILPDGNPATLELAAGLYAAVGRRADCEATLARIDAAPMPAGERELIRARHAMRWGPAGAAADWFGKAVAAAPLRADAWSASLDYAVMSCDAAAVGAILEDPRARDVDAVRFLAANRASVEAAMAEPRLRPAVSAAIGDAAGRAALIEAIQTTTRDWPDTAKRPATAAAMRRLAEANLRVLYLQILAAELSAEAGDLPAACEISKRAASRFPSSAPAAWQAAELLARNNRWPEALEMGLAWNDRASSQDLRPDTFVARAMLRTGESAKAVKTIEPQLSACLAHPDQYRELLVTYAVALVRSGRADKAGELFGDLVRTSGDWRTYPLSVLPVYLGTPAMQETWLDLCARYVPEEDAAARLALARAWFAGWNEYRSPSLLAKAKACLALLTEMPDASAAAFFSAALLAHQSGELETAASGYRRVLALDAKHLDARNNLAMVLADSGRWKEAVEEANAVVAAVPKNPTYRDTLAFALRKGGEYQKAADTLRSAIQIQPGNPEWRLSLAETLAEGGKVDEAVQELARVDELLAKGARLTRDAEARLDKMKARSR